MKDISTTAAPQRISVVGLGKLGACMAAAIASKGFNVIGVDVSAQTVDALNRGLAPVVEPGLQSLIDGNRPRLSATCSHLDAILSSDITFFVIPTPSEEDGGFSLQYALEAARECGKALAAKAGYHLFVLTSTVLPGATQYGVLPALEETSGKRCGQDFGLCYSPEFIALGTVVRDFLNPDFVLIGQSDDRAGSGLERFVKRVCDNDPPVKRMSFVNAELTKIAVNTFVTTKITFANMLAAICEELPGGDVDVVTSALGLDSRIGSRYLRGGMGYGGPCFPRDNRALACLARKVGQEALLANCTDTLNQQLSLRLFERIRSHIQPGMSTTVLGTSYKPGSNVVEESQPLLLAARLAEAGIRVTVFDPVAMENTRRLLGDRVNYADNLASAVASADAVIIANPDPAFLQLRASHFPTRTQPIVVIDCWRALNGVFSHADHVKYVRMGVGEDRAGLDRRLADAWGLLPANSFVEATVG